MNDFISESDVDIFLDGLFTISEFSEIFHLWRLLAKDPDALFRQAKKMPNAKKYPLMNLSRWLWQAKFPVGTPENLSPNALKKAIGKKTVKF